VDCAKVLLEAELDSPSVSTIQVLLLLSSYEAGHHRVARSWLYSGKDSHASVALV
jgi:hypothetical protein